MRSRGAKVKALTDAQLRDKQDAERYRTWVAHHHYWWDKKPELDALLDLVKIEEIKEGMNGS